VSDDPRQPAPSSPRDGGPYLLNPLTCRHRQQSRQLILRAAEAVAPGRAALLGAGACDEIPLAELVARFAHVTLNDIDEQPLSRAVNSANLDAASRAKVDVRIADLSGITRRLVERIENVLSETADPSSAIEAMSQKLEDQQPGLFPIGGKFDLVIASCVLSQLHFALTHMALARFERRFPGHADVLRESPRWTAALYQVARRMEMRFMDDLAGVLAKGGLVYLSESAQMCYIRLTTSGQWQTEGTYRMLRSKDLSDYLGGEFTIVERARWDWVVMPPSTAGETGRLYDVQALLLSRQKQ
jgi:hypothetical protein